MKDKRIRKAALGLAAAYTLACAAMPAPPSAVFAAGEADYIFHDTFESGDCDWSGRGGSKVQTSSAMPYADSKALYVSDRSDTWQGTQKSLTGFSAGTAYSFSVCAGYDSGPQSMKFQLTLAYKNSSGTTEYDHLAAVEALCGNYVQLANSNYTIPSGATDLVLFVETLSGSNAFYIDEAIAAAAGTVIEGPKAVEFHLGDVNSDGTVNAVDFSLAKRYCGKDFPNRTMQRAADLNQNNSVTAEDVLWYPEFLFTKTSEYPEKVAPPKSQYNYDPALKYHRFPDNYLNQASNPGQVIQETYNGPQGQNTLYVYLPPGYDESQQYNIFYLMHGGGENERTLFFQSDTMMQNIFDHMIENGELEPLIVVTPTFNQSGAEGFWQEYRERVVPFVEGKYSTYAESTDEAGLKASRMHRAYGGFSMGSVSTWAVLTHCLDITAYFMPLSGDHWGGTNTSYDKAKAIANAIDASGLEKNEYFIMCATGTQDIAYPNIGPQVEEMKKMSQFIYTSDLSQGNFYFLLADGPDHWWGHVRHYVYDMLPYFFHEG